MKHYSTALSSLHTTLVFSVIFAYLLGDTQGLQALHIYFGMTALLLVLIRVVWLVIGREYRSFDWSIASLKAYACNYAHYTPTEIKNPAASYSALLIWVLVGLLALTGFLHVGLSLHAGPLVWEVTFSKAQKEFIEEAHELFAQMLLMLSAIHVAGVLLEQVVKKTGLAGAMWQPRLGMFGLVGAFLGATLYLFTVEQKSLLGTTPSNLSISMQAPVMRQNCTECHLFFPVNLISESEWTRMMQTLDDHYGVDAAMEDEGLEIMKEEYLLLRKKGTMFSKGVANQTVRETKYWKKKHKIFDEAYFKRHELKPTQCNACHLQIEEGSANPLLMPLKLWF